MPEHPAAPGEKYAAGAEGQGRRAVHPWQMPWPAWKDVLWRTIRSVQGDRVGLVAAGVTFYLVLSIVPTLAAVLTIYGLLFDVNDVIAQVESLEGLVPGGVIDVLLTELALLAQSPEASGWSLALSLVIAVWGASKAHYAISEGLDVAYGERSSRGWVGTRLKSVLMASLTALVGIVTLMLIVIGPVVISWIGWEGAGFLAILRWPFLALVFWGWLVVLYRFGPSRSRARWRWVTTGSFLTTALWLAASMLLSWYAADLTQLGKTYGSLAGVVLLLLWLYIFGFCLLLGAELDSEIEHQTTKDTTVGPDQPLGERGAHVADTVGQAKKPGDPWLEPPDDRPPPSPPSG